MHISSIYIKIEIHVYMQFFGVHVWKNYIFTSLSTLYTNGLVIYMQTDNCYIYIYYTYNLKF